MGKLYVMECEGYIKIGNSDLPEARLAAFQTGNPYPVRLMGYMPIIDDVELAEKNLHHKYREFRVIGEWFNLPGEELRELVELTFLPSRKSGWFDELVCARKRAGG